LPAQAWQKPEELIASFPPSILEKGDQATGVLANDGELAVQVSRRCAAWTSSPKLPMFSDQHAEILISETINCLCSHAFRPDLTLLMVQLV
jgi:hypothetical protein